MLMECPDCGSEVDLGESELEQYGGSRLRQIIEVECEDCGFGPDRYYTTFETMPNE